VGTKELSTLLAGSSTLFLRQDARVFLIDGLKDQFTQWDRIRNPVHGSERQQERYELFQPASRI
jgi:hypothetical protein